MTVVAVIGGGVYATVLCESLSRALDGDALAVRLVARDAGRLSLIAGEALVRARAVNASASVVAARSFEEAVEGADHVVLLVRAGGLAARAWDEAFPRERGLVGDEGLGAGGISNAWRTAPLIAAMADTLRERAPNARVWNLVAPLGITTRVLLDAGVDAIGVCELPLVTRERWGLSDAELGYAGLNHLGWFWPRSETARAVLEAAPDVDGPTLRAFGAAPLRYYYELFDRDAAARLGVTRKPGRAKALATMADDAITAFRTSPGAWRPSRPTPWFDRALVPMIAAREGRAPWTGQVNVRNTGKASAFASPETVVELAATIDGGGVRTRVDSDVPVNVAQWLTAAAHVEELTYTAARDRDARALRSALAALPWQLTDDDVAWLAERVERGFDEGAMET